MLTLKIEQKEVNSYVNSFNPPIDCFINIGFEDELDSQRYRKK